MKAAIALDDWKLPVFRRRLDEAGFAYTDAGPGPGETTILSVEFEDLEALTKVVVASQAECGRTGRPRK